MLLKVPAVIELVQPEEWVSVVLSADPSHSVNGACCSQSDYSTSSLRWSSRPIPRTKKPLSRPKSTPEPTVVTPRVYDLCKDLYPDNKFKVMGRNTQKRIVLTEEEKRKHTVHEDNPEKIEWVKESRTVPYHYKSVIIDGTQYNVRFVLLDPLCVLTKHRLATLLWLKLEKTRTRSVPKWESRAQILS
jgi:DNA (cytosine-5)-methyltransferase 1